MDWKRDLLLPQGWSLKYIVPVLFQTDGSEEKHISQLSPALGPEKNHIHTRDNKETPENKERAELLRETGNIE